MNELQTDEDEKMSPNTGISRKTQIMKKINKKMNTSNNDKKKKKVQILNFINFLNFTIYNKFSFSIIKKSKTHLIF
jgi:hypothetical protein